MVGSRVKLVGVRRVLPICLLGLLMAAPAAAQSRRYPPEPVDKDREAAEKSKLWDNATNPNSEPYVALIAQAKQAISDRTDDGYKLAVERLDRAIALLPDEDEAYALRGAAYMQLQDWAKCATDLQRARSKADRGADDRSGKARIEQRRDLGLCQARAGKLADAERTLSEAAASGTGTGEMLMRLGEVRIAMGKLDEAIAALTAALDSPDNPSQPMTRWLLASAYDRARRPAEAIDEAKRAAGYDSRFSSLRNPTIPLLGVGETEYLLGLAWSANEPPRPEYALLYFRKFLKLAPDSPWRKRAEDHLRELKTVVLPDAVERRPGGTASVDLEAARAIVRKQMPAMRACLASVPNQAIEVKITRSGPRSTTPRIVRPDPFANPRGRYRPPPPPAAPPDGIAVTSSSELPLEASRAEIDAAARCVEPIASKLVMPAVKEKDAWYQVAFLVIAP
ncbi:MAG: Tetratricopeptide 2 repeat protein [Myxococcales bacterium]|nr:Tetratricopeptide 2 repeat protein [Myxococcales bacterium]